MKIITQVNLTSPSTKSEWGYQIFLLFAEYFQKQSWLTSISKRKRSLKCIFLSTFHIEDSNGDCDQFLHVNLLLCSEEQWRRKSRRLRRIFLSSRLSLLPSKDLVSSFGQPPRPKISIPLRRVFLDETNFLQPHSNHCDENTNDYDGSQRKKSRVK